MPVPAALREPGRERARQRVDRLLELLHLLARRVHEVDVFGQRLAQRARHRLDAAVGDEPAADLGLDHLLQDLQPAFEVFAREPLVERALADLLVLLRLLHHLADEAVGVELPQRAVEVVRAADRPARLHAREARDRGAPRACASRSRSMRISASRSICASSSFDSWPIAPPPIHRGAQLRRSRPARRRRARRLAVLRPRRA